MKKQKKPFDADKFTAIALLILVCILAAFIATVLGLMIAQVIHDLRITSLAEDKPAEGVARITPEAGEVTMWTSPVCTEDTMTVYTLEEYTEGDAPVPEWWNPEEPMAAEWMAPEPHPPVGIDPGGVDWNICSTVWGWDGHSAELWELDLLARIFYLEFWGTSLPCSEAGCDAILNLWDTGRYGQTLFEALSYYDPDYGYTYRVYPKVWQTNYDADGLEWCKEFCTERFINGPEWSAVYFQLGGYHDTDWVPPLYEMDGVYFSGKGQ